MQEQLTTIFEYLKNHYEWVLIATGFLILLGAIRDWDWLIENPSGKFKHSFIGAFVIETWGRNGIRVVYGIFGVVLILCAALFLWLGK